MTHYLHKQPKPVTCVCGIRFRKIGLKPWYPYHNAACKLKHVTGKGTPDISMPLQTLKDLAKGAFCDYIKLRDKDKPEITSGQMEKKGEVINGGHLFDCAQYPGLLFHEDNCFKQSEFFNLQMWETEVWLRTSVNVKVRIGEKRYHELLELSQSQFIRNYKWSALEYIEQWEIFTNKINQLKVK